MSGTPGARRRAALLLAVICCAGLGLLVTAGLRGTLVYYRTPSEVGVARTAEQRMRLGGEVVPGSVRRTDGLTRFRLSDGKREVPVAVRGALPDTFREGQDAVVEGVLGGDGTLRSDQVAVKHSNEYRAAGDTR